VKGRIDLCIAGVRLCARCSENLRMEDIGPVYRDFCCGRGGGGERIDLITRSGLPAEWTRENLERLFDTGQSWSLFRGHTDYFLAITRATSPEDIEPACIAVFRKEMNEVAVFCNDTPSVKPGKGHATVPTPFYYPLDRLLMMFILSARNGVMLHAAGAEINGRGFVFAGRSGAGKSTISKQLASGTGPVVFSDERIIARKIGGAFRMFGTPWPGDAGIAVNGSAPLSSILFIGHGDGNTMERLSPQEALVRLLPVSTIPWYDTERMTGVLAFCEELVSYVPSYELRFSLDGGIVGVLDKFAASL